MVVADQGSWLADVVFVIEGTANMSPYIESLKSNYILPTLEYFNGSPADDRDCGSDTNCTMYALVIFSAADCAPETSSTCFPPTASTHKFLTFLDKVKFIGGGGEAFSHIAEGLATALQVFDDFQTFRENSVQTQKHCILICNSPPYLLPALESFAYSGLMTEQIASVMAERQINFSIFSPRKIPALNKIYEKAGGDLQHALAKNYAKDRRHLVLLKGFQLQERPMTPPSIDSKSAIPATGSVCSPPATTGQKRPATSSPPHPREATGFKQPATQSNYNGLDWPSTESPAGSLPVQNQVPSSIQGPTAGQSPMSYGQTSIPGQPNQPLPQRPGIPTPPSHLSSLNQPNPPNVTITNKGPPQHSEGIRPQRGHSPVPSSGPRMSWNQTGAPSSPASTPPTTSVLANQLNNVPSAMPMRHTNPQMQGTQNVSNIVSQAQPTINPNQNVLNTGRGNLPNLNLRMSSTSPGPTPIQNNNPMGVQINQHQPFGQTSQPSQQPNSMAGTMPSSVQSKLGSATSGNQMMPTPGQTMTTAAPSNMPMQPVSGILPLSQSTSQQGQQPTNPSVTTKDRRTIWQGILEFQEKSNSPQVQGQRVTHSLPCTFSSMVTNNGEPDVNAEKWPNRLMLQLIPKHLIVVANLFSTLKTAARHVLIHFNQETEALAKLCKNMSSGLVGCIQFQNPVDIRIMVVLYMPDKRIYMGFIANDQESFFNNIRQRYENHRKQQQQQKQRMQAGNIPVSDSMGIQPTNPTNPNMMMAQPNASNLNQPNNTQMNSCMPINQPQVPQINPPPPQAQAPNTGMVHSGNANNQANAARLSQLEAARQQNLLNMQHLQQTLEAAQQKELQYKAAQELHQQQLMIEKQNANRLNTPLKIQQLQQTLEAAQQKELQYKAAQEQQKQQQQQQQQQMIERQNAIRHLQQQLQHQQQQLAQQQQSINMQTVQQQVNQQPNSHNPQLRNLLQQQQVQQQIRRQQQQQQQQQQQHQMLMHPQGIRPQLSGNIPQGGIGSNVGQPQQQQQSQQQNQQQSWGDLGILDSLPP